jgi:alkane 1-monooxygenase
VARAAAALPPALVAALPASAAVASFYAAHAPACDAALATLAGLIGVAAGFVVLPALDVALGEEREEEMAGDDASYRAWLYASGAFHIALVAAGVAAAPMLAAAPLTAVTLSVGLSGGLAFTVAHELIHGRAPPDRAAAAALLAVACYGHWRDAHLAHHKNVGTFADPATARLGESLFAFIPRSVLGGVADGLAADRARVAARGWTASRVPLWVAAPAAGVAAAAAWGGGASVAFFLGQAAMGVFMLETVNYIEHYGLERRLVATGDG